MSLDRARAGARKNFVQPLDAFVLNFILNGKPSSLFRVLCKVLATEAKLNL